MEILKRRDAMAQGLGKYFTGKPCIRGHIAERYTDAGACSECVSDASMVVRHGGTERREAKAGLMTIEARAYHVDKAKLLDTVFLFTKARHPSLERSDVILNPNGWKLMGGTLSYKLNVDSQDVAAIRRFALDLHELSHPFDAEAERKRIYGNLIHDAEAIQRQPDRDEWKFT